MAAPFLPHPNNPLLAMGRWGQPAPAIAAAPYSPMPSQLGSGMFSPDVPPLAMGELSGAMQGVETAPLGWMDQLKGQFGDIPWLTTKDASGMQTQGLLGLGLGAAQGVGNLFMGMQQYGLAKDALAQGKLQFDKNFAAQAATTNSALEDRQRARVAANAGAYQSVGDYMTKHGVR